MIEDASSTVKKIKSDMILVGVTILTSLNENNLMELGFKSSLEEIALNLAKLGKENGIDGVVCSIDDISGIKASMGSDFLLVTPGVRMLQENDDQKRSGSIYDAIQFGTDFVVGREITQAENPEGVLKNRIFNSLKMKFLKIKMVLFTIFFVACSQSDNFQYNGVVVTRHHLASDVGATILKQGGNAFDSAIAVAFALAVVNPSAGNLGGGGFIVYFKNNRIFTVDYREKAPIRSSRDMFLNPEGDVVKGLSLESYLASGTPGTVAGLIQLHKDEASMPLEKLIAPAVILATEGFKLSEFQAQYLNKYAKKFMKNKEAEKIFVKEGGWRKDDLLIQKDLGKSLSLIAKKGSKAFYDGDITKKILNDFKDNGGIFIEEDFLSYEIRKLEPLCGTYKSYEICSMPPPSSGGVAIIQMLNILENFDVKNFSHSSLEYIFLLKNIMSFAYADRSVFLGDPDYFNVPVDELISKNYARKIAEKIKNKETTKIQPGMLIKESEETTHFSIIDKWGNAVSNTYTLNGAYGSGIVAKGTGILMNNEMDDFSQNQGIQIYMGL